jgi:hypothetical protein
VLYVASLLAHRLDGANHVLIQLKNQLQTGESRNVVAKTVSDFSRAAPALFMPDIDTIRSHNIEGTKCSC